MLLHVSCRDGDVFQCDVCVVCVVLCVVRLPVVCGLVRVREEVDVIFFYSFTFPFVFQSACDSSPCQNGGKCAPDFSGNAMKCVCPREYVGDTCGRSGARYGPVTGHGKRHSRDALASP